MLTSCCPHVTHYHNQVRLAMRYAGVFQTQELQEHIFSHADQQSLARCARVCKNWTDTCLDNLWAEINIKPDIYDFLSVLGPMGGVSLTFFTYLAIVCTDFF